MARCKCTLSQSLTGDGCELCQPETAIDYYKQTIADLEQENEQLQTTNKQLLESLERFASNPTVRANHPITCELAEEAITNAKQAMGDKG